MHEAERQQSTNDPELHQGAGNSYEVAVDDATCKARVEDGPKEQWFTVETVWVLTGNPHIKEYKVNVKASGTPPSP